jgi:hypothetical protein
MFLRLKPQALYRPQTACGRYCPWEPTALKSLGRLYLSPTVVTATITPGTKAKPVPEEYLIEGFPESAAF